eukprot:scaffold12956_cov21-Tisochrysis_lutea.AAC.5
MKIPDCNCQENLSSRSEETLASISASPLSALQCISRGLLLVPACVAGVHEGARDQGGGEGAESSHSITLQHAGSRDALLLHLCARLTAQGSSYGGVISSCKITYRSPGLKRTTARRQHVSKTCMGQSMHNSKRMTARRQPGSSGGVFSECKAWLLSWSHGKV